MRVYIPLLIMVMLLSGCAHKFTPETVARAIVNGKTTKNEVLASFGPPDNIMKTAGMKITSGSTVHVIQKSREVWRYSPHQLKLLDSIEPELLKIVFDDDGVVAYFDFKADD